MLVKCLTRLEREYWLPSVSLGTSIRNETMDDLDGKKQEVRGAIVQLLTY